MLSEQNRFPNHYCDLAVYVDRGIKDEVAGYLVHIAENQAWRCENIACFVKTCEKVFNSINYPQATHLLRQMGNGTGRGLKHERGIDDMAVKTDNIPEENKPTFLIKIKYRQNASWQGSIKWLETDTEKNFRSALELIKLMDDAVGHSDDIGWE